MGIFVAATLGMATFIVTWTLGLSADVGALIAVCFILVGILLHKMMPLLHQD